MRWMAVLLIAIAAWGGAGAVASARDELFDYDVGITALLCEQDPGGVPMRDAPFPPDGCELASGIQLSLLTRDGAPVGSCVTANTGRCRIFTDFDEVYVFQVESGSIPTGYSAPGYPRLVHVTATSIPAVLIRTEALDPAPDAATITIHSRVCPGGYDGSDWFNDCHGTPPSFPQAIGLSGPAQRGAWIDGEGNATFSGLQSGDWTIRPALPDDTASLFAFCSRTSEPGVEFPSTTTLLWESEPSSSWTRLTLAPGDDILCDLYIVPVARSLETAQVTFHIRNCSERIPIDELYEQCHGRGSRSSFAIAGAERSEFYREGYLDDQGNVTLQLPPGRYVAYPSYGHSVVGSYVYCSQDGIPDSGVEGYPVFAAGEAWTCDVYFRHTTFRGA